MRLLICIFSLLCLSAFGQQDLSRAYRHVSNADSLYERGQVPEAIEELRKAIISKKNDPNIYLFLSRCLIEQDMVVQAKKYLRRASRIGNYEAQQLLDSLKGNQNKPIDKGFERDLEEYLEKTGEPNEN